MSLAAKDGVRQQTTNTHPNCAPQCKKTTRGQLAIDLLDNPVWCNACHHGHACIDGGGDTAWGRFGGLSLQQLAP